MKTTAAFLLLICCLAECRKIVPPLDKNANINFINMEAGGLRAAPVVTQSPAKVSVNQGGLKPQLPPVQLQKPVASPVKPPSPAPVQVPVPTPAKPVPAPVPSKSPTPHQIKPVPVNPAPISNPLPTPGPSNVKQLITFYDSKGKASAIRPYSYSQAVKQG